MSEIVHEKVYVGVIRKKTLSNDTFCRGIPEISGDQFQQQIIKFKKSPRFIIQLDETSDASNMAQLQLQYTCRVSMKNALKENCFFVALWKATTYIR